MVCVYIHIIVNICIWKFFTLLYMLTSQLYMTNISFFCKTLKTELGHSHHLSFNALGKPRIDIQRLLTSSRIKMENMI